MPGFSLDVSRGEGKGHGAYRVLHTGQTAPGRIGRKVWGTFDWARDGTGDGGQVCARRGALRRNRAKGWSFPRAHEVGSHCLQDVAFGALGSGKREFDAIIVIRVIIRIVFSILSGLRLLWMLFAMEN